MGNAVDTAGIRQELIAFERAGLGGVEITPIYGVKGEEPNYLDFLSPKWMALLNYTIEKADSLGMQVAMILGTGWPYGGPQVSSKNAASRLIVDQITLQKGEKINRKIIVSDEKDKNTASLNYVLAFGDDGTYLDLTGKLKGNLLKWQAKDTGYTLYVVFTGKTGQQVKRAAPGGAGNVLDHYSHQAFNSYVVPFDSAFARISERPKIIFNDSYEVYEADFTSDFFAAFQDKRGYDLKPQLQRLLRSEDTEEANRVKSDYRETLSELLLSEFCLPWTEWVHNMGARSKLQAHGSPGNLLDLYASADIPECETFGSMPYDIPGLRRENENIREGDADPVMLKFSSSAAHLTGKSLTSSETFTWLREHFKTALSQCKPEAEDLLLNGVNHIFLHGATYSPERAGWPGWKFYASVNFTPNNTIWEDAPSLFSYLTNCQKLLQAGNPDNEILLYWPVYDVWDSYLNGKLLFQFSIHSLEEWLLGTPFYSTAKNLMETGYGVDFISDSFIATAKVVDGDIVLPGVRYRCLVVPNTENMPLRTLQHIIKLKKEGAQIIFEGLPESVPGFYQYKVQKEKLANLIRENKEITTPSRNTINSLFERKLYPETLVNTGLKFIRREIAGEKMYFLVNHTHSDIRQYVPIQAATDEVVIYDPLTGSYGRAAIKKETRSTLVKVHIPAGGSLFIRTGNVSDLPNWDYYLPLGNPIPIQGNWQLNFLKGGPELPGDTTLTTLKSWTELGISGERFSGTGRYEIEFNKPKMAADNWMLNLGDVRESAKIWLNDHYLGTAWSVPFSLTTGRLRETNRLVIEVTNLAANRIRAKEQLGEEWKIFHEINMVNKDYEKFDARLWKPMPSGLLGTISLTPLQLEK